VDLDGHWIDIESKLAVPGVSIIVRSTEIVTEMSLVSFRLQIKPPWFLNCSGRSNGWVVAGG
jgi:hypothetical protein